MPIYLCVALHTECRGRGAYDDTNQVGTCETEAGASRALATLLPGVGLENIGMADMVSRGVDGKVRFAVTHDLPMGLAALEGAGCLELESK